MKRKGSSHHQFEQRLPADLKSRLEGMTLEVPLGEGHVPITISPKMRALRFSLRTFDPGEAKRRQAIVIAHLEGLYARLRAGAPLSLSHKQCVALAGEAYRAWAADLEVGCTVSFQMEADGTVVRVEPADAETVRADMEVQAKARRQAAERLRRLDGDSLAEKVGPLVDRVLQRNGIPAVDARSRAMLLMEFSVALAEGMEAGAKKVEGDYRSDASAERFPVWEAPAPSPPSSPVPKVLPSVSLCGLFDGWWREAEATGRSLSTKESYGAAVRRLGAFLGHDDAVKVQKDDVIRFKDHLVTTPSEKTGKPLSAKSVKDSYLAGLKSVFGWAVVNGKLPANPAEGVTLKAARKRKLRDKWFTPEEARAILDNASNSVRRPKEPWQRLEGRRWVPWLCSYTGARLGEMVQLRKEDLRHEDGHWVIHITPEAVTVKDSEARDVPLHPHLVEMGFPEFVQSAPNGPLFMWSGTGRAAWETAKNRITEEVRTVLTDPNVKPSHGWRDTFKAVGLEVGISDWILHAIEGHAPRTVGETYGGATIKAKAAALEKFPRWPAKPLTKES